MFSRCTFGFEPTAKVTILLLFSCIAISCVSLKKPTEVATCAASKEGCSDDGLKKDAAILNDGETDSPRPDIPWDSLPDAVGDSTIPEDHAGSDAQDVTKDTNTDGDIDGKKDTASGIDSPDSPDAGIDGGSPDTVKRDEGIDVSPEPGPELGPEPGPEPPIDGGLPEALPPTYPCSSATPVTGGNFSLSAMTASCFVTCDNMQYGWGCSSFTTSDRSLKVNGTAVTCGGVLPVKKTPGNYYYFEIGPGGHTWDLIHWSGTAAASCPMPAGGFLP
jgi:hypothetical protein